MKNSYKDIQNQIFLTRVQKGWCYYAEYNNTQFLQMQQQIVEKKPFIEITVMLVKVTVTTSIYCFLKKKMNIVLTCGTYGNYCVICNGF